MALLQNCAQFSHLPIELRQKIWLDTFSPRVLKLHIHKSFELEQGPLAEVNSFISVPGYDISRARQLVAVHFTATVLNDDKDSDGLVCEQDPKSGFCREMHPPLDPVALFVCRESRALAVQRYTPSFGGTLHREKVLYRDEDIEKWERGGYSEKRIWIDFKHDTLVLGCFTTNEGFWGYLDHPCCLPIYLLADYAEMETKMIRRLVLRGFWKHSMTRRGVKHLRLRTYRDGQRQHGSIWSLYKTGMWKLSDLRELIIHDTWDSVQGAGLDTYWTVEEEREFVAERLKTERSRIRTKSNDQVWTQELPIITVIRDTESSASLGKGFRRLTT